MRVVKRYGCCIVFLLACSFASAQTLTEEFIYEQAPFAQCHASTLAEISGGFAAAWFGGTAEGKSDVEIWFATKKGGQWSAPQSVANGQQVSGERYPCWNPVLFRKGGQLSLFYKVGPSPREWWGMVIRSSNDGLDWSAPERLPEGVLGPIKNKPVLLADGRLLAGSSTEHDGWRVHMEWTEDEGASWKKSGFLNSKGKMESIQPTILQLADGRLQILCRSRSAGKITTAFSEDRGDTWSAISATTLPNNNSGLDAVTLANGQQVLVYNHLNRSRHQLHVASSKDGKAWNAVMVLENEPGNEFSYPAVIQSEDGLVHITYTWKRRRIKHVVFDPAAIETTPIVDGVWPSVP